MNAQTLSQTARAAAAAAVAAALTSTPHAAAITIQFDYSFDTNGFFNQQVRRDTLEAAADFFETALVDDLDAIQPGPSGFGFDNTWSVSFSHPGTGGSASVLDLAVPADTLILYAGGRNLGGSTLGQGGYGGYFGLTGTGTFVTAASTRGEGTVSGAGATDFARWGGSISFDTDSTWNFDLTDPTFPENDFYSVALHELGHALGIGTADSWDNLINGSNQFTGTNAVAEHGGNVPLQSGGFHWAASTMSQTFDNTAQEAAMDPNITTGTRKVFTRLDVAGLDDLGWDVNYAAIPQPTTLTLLVAASALTRRRR